MYPPVSANAFVQTCFTAEKLCFHTEMKSGFNPSALVSVETPGFICLYVRKTALLWSFFFLGGVELYDDAGMQI